MITSTRNPRIQWVRKLQTKPSYRGAEGVFVVEGVRLVEEALNTNWVCSHIFHTDVLSDRGKELLAANTSPETVVELVSLEVMRSMSDTKSPQGILAVVKKQALPLPGQLDFLLILDQLRDPGNLGTIIRTAAAAGVEAIFMTPGSVDAFSPKVLRAGMGAQFRVPILSKGWKEISTSIADSELRVHLATPENGVPYYEMDFRQPLALIIGGEAEGAVQDAYQVADTQVCIPMPGGVESLNASVAAGILLFEIVRQR